jgi:hypothetical protein
VQHSISRQAITPVGCLVTCWEQLPGRGVAVLQPCRGYRGKPIPKDEVTPLSEVLPSVGAYSPPYNRQRTWNGHLSGNPP